MRRLYGVRDMPSIKDRLASDDRLREVPAALWEQIKADPSRAPEYIALAAAEFHGPSAAEWVQSKRGFYNTTSVELANMTKKRHVAAASFEGAALGVGGFITILPDLAALAWIQSRMVFHIAAAYGYDPRDPARPAELLVIQGLYPDVPSARLALDGAGKRMAGALVRRRLTSETTVLARLARMVGKRMGKRMLGRVIPFAASVFNAAGNRKDTLETADRAMAYYGAAPAVVQPASHELEPGQKALPESTSPPTFTKKID